MTTDLFPPHPKPGRQNYIIYLQLDREQNIKQETFHPYMLRIIQNTVTIITKLHECAIQ